MTKDELKTLTVHVYLTTDTIASLLNKNMLDKFSLKLLTLGKNRVKQGMGRVKRWVWVGFQVTRHQKRGLTSALTKIRHHLVARSRKI